MSNANRVNLAFVEETTYGEVPAGPPTLQDLRFTSESLLQETGSTSSQEIRSDRQVSDVIRTGINAAGDMNIEMSYDAYDEFLAAALMSAGWSTLKTDTQITFSMDDADNSVNDSASGFVTAGFVANQWVKISGFTETANNGYFKLVSVAVGKMVLAAGTVVTEVAGDSVTINMGAQIINGTTFTSYVVEKEFSDLASEFAVYTGMAIDQMNLSIATEQVLTGGLTFIGAKEESKTATVGDGSNTAAPTKSVLNAIDHVTSILENAVAYDATSFNMQLINNLRRRLQIGTLGAVSIGEGTVGVTGTIQSYFESKTIMDKYLGWTPSALTIVLEDGAGNGYVIDMPRIKYTSGQRVAGGINQDVIADMNYTAYMHATEGITIRIAKFPAA